MPITLHFNPEAKLIICVHTGRVLNNQFLNCYKSMVESDLFTAATNLLIDLRQTDSSPRNQEVLRQVADLVKLKLADAGTYPKIAVIAPKDVSFGMARMYQFLTDSIPWDFVVFRSADTALAWLRAPADLMDDLYKKAHQVIPPGNESAASA